ncbi:MAG: MopE-related protein [Bacteroidota bacterium]
MTGSQPAAPTIACYETATWNGTSCQYDVTGSKPAAPTIACYETATWNGLTCQYDVTGSQPAAPTVACYETATWNGSTCQYDITGSQPAVPSVACYQTATWNPATCQYDLTGSPAAAIVTTTSACDSYTWPTNGQTYTQSGTYNYNSNCQDYTLELTINITQTYYADADGDGYGNSAISTTSCTGVPTGYVANSTDCDDNSSSVHPGATEICFNNIDDDCDGLIDEFCVCTNPSTANAGSNLNACQGQPVTLNGSIGGGATMGTWTTSGTGTFSNVNALNATYTPSAADALSGSVTLTLTTDAIQPCTPASSSITVNVAGIPANAGVISGPANVCKPLSNTFTYSITPVAGASSYTWSVPAGVSIQGSATGNSITVKFIDSYVQPGLNGNICVTANNANSCFASQPSCLTISVNVSAPNQPASIVGPYTACPGDSGTYSVPTVARASVYNWTIPSNTSLVSSNANTIRIAYGQAFTSGAITVNVSNSCGVSNTRIRNVSPTVLAAPDSIFGQRDSMCTVTSTRTYKINKVQGALNYYWTVPAGTSIIGNATDTAIVVDFSSGIFTYGKITAAGVNACGVGNAKILYLNSFEYKDSGCVSYTLPWSNVVTTSGDYSHVYNGSSGCDSTVIAHITIFSPTSSEFTATGCDSYLLPWNSSVTSSGDYTHHYTTTKGCDSLVTAHITIVNSTSNTTVASACDNYTWSVNGTTYTQSGNYSSVTGCHTEILQLTITPSSTQTSSASACDSYVWAVNGVTYTQSGSYSALVGCVTKVLNLTITNSTTNTTNISRCDSYVWSVNGTTYTQSGTYSSVSGCNTEILNLTITPSSTVNSNISECTSYTWSANGNTYTQSGNYTSVSGCVTSILHLTIIPATTNYTASACDSYIWNINGTTYTQSGVYSSVSGCHTDVLTLTITPSTSNTTSINVCDSYTWSVNGRTYTQSGTYSSVTGCHTEILQATINPTITYYADADGDGYGNPSISVSNCTGAPTGYVALSGDCDDNNSSIHPNAVEICFNNIDDDCDGLIDENCICSNPPTAFAGSNLNACQGQGVILNGAIGGGATMATWTTSGTGTFSPNATTLNATYTPSLADATAGTITLTLTSDAPVPCTPASSSISVNVTPLPINVGAISGSTNICSPGSALFTYSVTPVAGAASYTWTVPAGIQIMGSSTGSSIIVKFIDTYVQAGLTGQICVTANNSNGCANAVQSCITVSAQVSAPVTPSSISGPQAACPGDIATYSISTVSRASGYNWAFPSGTSVLSGANSNIITVQYPQNFTGTTLSVAATNACGTSGTRTRSVSLNTLSAPGSISGPVDGICGATNAVYSIAAVNGATSYTWTLPAGATISGSNNGRSIVVNYTGATVGSGNVTVAAVNNCGTGAARSLAVKLVPGLPGPINGEKTVCTGSTENYSIGTVQGASSYIWTVPGGATILSGQGSKSITVVHAAVASANGIITVKASNSCGSSSVRVLSINNISCPRNGQIGTLSMVAYPNPTHDVLNVEFALENDETAAVKMFDASGRMIYTENINAIAGANRTAIQVNDFAKGVYLLQLESNNKLEKLRVVVE